MLARELPWSQGELVLLQEWIELWHQAWQVRAGARPARWLRRAGSGQRPWFRRPWPWAAVAISVIAALPVHLSVLVPGELVPLNPAVVRAPLDGVIGVFQVRPNADVRAGQPLFTFEENQLRSRLEVAQQALLTAEAEYRQAAQQALTEPRAKAQLANLAGRIEERRVESALLTDQLERAQVLSPRDGIALFDDPTDWIGRPVTVGERILRVAAPDDVEIEAWVPLGDAIPLPEDAPVALFLNASPIDPVTGTVRYFSHEAVPRPDGTYAYRLRAKLEQPTTHRVGLKGTVRLEGRRVSIAYWVLRRPWARVRIVLGL